MKPQGYLYFTVIYPIAIDILTKYLLFALQLAIFKDIILCSKQEGKIQLLLVSKRFLNCHNGI